MFDVTKLSDITENGVRKASFRTCDIDLKEDIILRIQYTKGCQGNTKGLAALCEGMKKEDVIARLEGIDCKGRGTSCPDQLARALKLL
jgi:uncharacterized protein (TIGR03905 family)